MKLFAAPKERKNQRVYYNEYHYSFWEFLKYLCIGLLIGILAVWLCYRSVWGLPFAVLFAILYVRRKKKTLIERRKNLLLFHFKDFIGALHTALSSGYSVENGIRSSLSDMRQLYGENDVIVRELRIMAAGLKLHRPVEELFADFGERSGLEDIRLFSELVAIAKRQGGSMGKVLSDTREIITQKIETAQEIDKILSSKIYEQKIMSIMPAAVILYLRMTFDGFIEQLYGNFIGVMIMTACLMVYILAYWMGRRIVHIEV